MNGTNLTFNMVHRHKQKVTAYLSNTDRPLRSRKHDSLLLSFVFLK